MVARVVEAILATNPELQMQSPFLVIASAFPVVGQIAVAMQVFFNNDWVTSVHEHSKVDAFIVELGGQQADLPPDEEVE